MASGPASHVKPVTKQTFGRASPGAAREAAGEALPNGAYVLLVLWGENTSRCKREIGAFYFVVGSYHYYTKFF